MQDSGSKFLDPGSGSVIQDPESRKQSLEDLSGSITLACVFTSSVGL